MIFFFHIKACYKTISSYFHHIKREFSPEYFKSIWVRINQRALEELNNSKTEKVCCQKNPVQQQPCTSAAVKDLDSGCSVSSQTERLMNAG